ncbi:MAG TPA: sodium:solute symporter family protein [Thermoanaerobaculia bacterium]|nr:sodium:solute symporter family protein [Thermoanaerobaculia bacterium]
MIAVLLAAYLLAMLAIGLASRRKASAGESAFYVADRSYGPFRGFVALASTTTGGSSTLVCAALVWRHGLSGIWIDLAGAVGLALLAFGLAGRVRRTGAMTLPEIAGRFYGAGARTAAGALVAIAEVVWFALLVEASQAVLTSMTGLPATRALVLSAAVFIAYTSLGGQYAVVRTDFVQYALMVAGILGIGTLAAARAIGGRFSPPAGSLAFPVSPTLGWGDVGGWLLLVGLPHLVGGDVYAKLLSCRDSRSARLAASGAAASKVAFGAAVAFIALSARQQGLALGSDAQALPAALGAFAPGLLGAFVAVALIATMQSSADSVLLTGASVAIRDVAPAFGRRPGIAAARAIVPVFGAVGLVIALQMREIVETLRLGYSIFAAGMILPILFGFFRPLWVPGRDAIAAMVTGGAVALGGRFFPPLGLGRDPVVAGTAANLAVLLFAIARTRIAGKCPGDVGAAPYPASREETSGGRS